MKVLTQKEKTKRINRVLSEVRKFPVIEGYYVVSYSHIARETGLRPGMIHKIMQKLEDESIIEIRQSVGLFGGAYKRGIKFLGNEQ